MISRWGVSWKSQEKKNTTTLRQLSDQESPSSLSKTNPNALQSVPLKAFLWALKWHRKGGRADTRQGGHPALHPSLLCGRCKGRPHLQDAEGTSIWLLKAWTWSSGVPPAQAVRLWRRIPHQLSDCTISLLVAELHTTLTQGPTKKAWGWEQEHFSS